MTCVQGFCVPAETPKFAAVCSSTNNSSVSDGAPTASIGSTEASSSHRSFAHIRHSGTVPEAAADKSPPYTDHNSTS